MMKPSAGVSKTMSASFKPLCGRAPSGSFPILTRSAGRFGIVFTPGAGASVKGQRGPAAVTAAGVVVLVVVVVGGIATMGLGDAARPTGSPTARPTTASELSTT